MSLDVFCSFDVALAPCSACPAVCLLHTRPTYFLFFWLPTLLWSLCSSQSNPFISPRIRCWSVPRQQHMSSVVPYAVHINDPSDALASHLFLFADDCTLCSTVPPSHQRGGSNCHSWLNWNWLHVSLTLGTNHSIKANLIFSLFLSRLKDWTNQPILFLW